MSDIPPKETGFPPEGKAMSSVAEARGILSELIGLMRPGEKLKNRFPLVATLTGIRERRLRGVWHGEARRIDAHEMDRLRAAKTRKDAVRARKYAQQIENMRAAYEQAGKLESVAEALEASDAEFHAATINLARSEAKRLLDIAGHGMGR